MSKLNTFNEAYIVKLNYKKLDGYWVIGHKEEVLVPVIHGVNEKNNFAKAETLAKKKFPGCVITSISYV